MPELLNDSIPSAEPDAVSRRIFAWPRDTTPAERQTLMAGGLGWMLDAMDVMLYSLVLAFLIREFAMDTRTAGFLNSLTLLASAIGGFFFGWVADRIGRTRALMASIVLYSIASAACGFSHTIPQLATFRFLLGLGMGGEWTAGAALIAETWRAEHRGKGAGIDAVHVRHWRSHCRAGRRGGLAALRLARGVFCGRAACLAGFLDSAPRPGTCLMEATPTSQSAARSEIAA